MTTETGTAVPMATSGVVRVLGLSQTNCALGHCRGSFHFQHCVAILQEVAPDRRHVRRIDRRFVADLYRNCSYSHLRSRNIFQISIELAFDACGETWILHLNVCNDGTRIGPRDDVYARQAHRLSKIEQI